MTKARNIAELANDISVDSNRDVTLSNLRSDQPMMFRNRIINGDMRISQRYGEANPQNNAGGSYHVDRFGMYYLGNSYTTQQSTTAPDGFLHSLKLTVDGTTTPTYSFFGQRIEGLNVAHLGFGKSWAKTITISFWVRSSVTGVYSIAVTNGNGDRAYAVQYTINAADTWEQKTATIAGDTTGTWLVNNANGLYLRFNLGSPSGRLISADSWQAANADGATSSTGADTWATTSGATFYITGVQLEEGTVPTPFEHRPIGTELALCQRYYYLIGREQYARYAIGYAASATNIRWLIFFKTTMRTVPDLEQSGNFGIQPGTLGTFDIELDTTDSTGNQCLLRSTDSSGLSAGNAVSLHSNNDINAYLAFYAEL